MTTKSHLEKIFFTFEVSDNPALREIAIMHEELEQEWAGHRGDREVQNALYDQASTLATLARRIYKHHRPALVE